MIVRALVVWFGIMLLAIANGFIRESLVSPRFGPQSGHVISTLLLATAIFAVAAVSIEWIGPEKISEAFRVGLFWVVLTLAFEFLAGHYLFGAPWSKIVADYNIFNGRIWPLIPLTVMISPAWAWVRLVKFA